MILLKSNEELKRTFEKLILTLKVPVEWTGVFAVVGDYLILQGEVRSLFFNFETRGLATNLIEIPMTDEPVAIQPGSRVQNILNLILYTFGKWGKIRGLRVDQTYARLNVMFASVMEEIKIRPELSEDNFRFYQDGIRINYEDLIQIAMEEMPDPQDNDTAEEEEGIGLWHNMIWQSRRESIRKTTVDFEDTSSQRLGNNYYMVGFLCPSCASPLHMIIFPEKKEVQIETDQGEVVLARTYTCASCHRFLTPWPKKLLADGEYFEFDFEADDRAYIDYLELLGKNGERTFNHRFNRFLREQKEQTEPEDTAEESLEERIEQEMDFELSQGTERMQNMIDEGFYSEVAVRRMVEKKKAAAIRNAKSEAAQKAQNEKVRSHSSASGNETSNAYGADQKRTVYVETEADTRNQDPHQEAKQQEPADAVAEERKEAVTENTFREPAEERAEQEPLEDTGFREHRKTAVSPEQQNSRTRSFWSRKIKRPGSLSHIRRTSKKNIDRDKLWKMNTIRLKHSEPEVQMAENLSVNNVEVRYPADDMTSHQDRKDGSAKTPAQVRPQNSGLDNKKSMERISFLIANAPKRTRSDLEQLRIQLRDPDLDPEVAVPFLTKVEDKIRQIDQLEISKIAGSPSRMSFHEASEALSKLEEGLFLPELKENAIELLRQRLIRIKQEECRNLAEKFENQLKGTIKLTGRYHFNHMQESEDNEILDSVIRNALVSYAYERGEFEYPILVLDTSRAENGAEGLVLTPDHLFYHNLFTTYQVRIAEIAHLYASTGLLNKGVYLHRHHGDKLKIPYVAESKELKKWAEELEKMIQYLQEKPESRNVPYLAQETHQKIICLRCGHSYMGGDICPNCGYTGNQ